MARNFVNFAGPWTLNGGINDSVTSVVVNEVITDAPAVDFTIVINEEVMLVTSKDEGTKTFTVTRNWDGRGATTHANTDEVRHVFTATDMYAAAEIATAGYAAGTFYVGDSGTGIAATGANVLTWSSGLHVGGTGGSANFGTTYYASASETTTISFNDGAGAGSIAYDHNTDLMTLTSAGDIKLAIGTGGVVDLTTAKTAIEFDPTLGSAGDYGGPVVITAVAGYSPNVGDLCYQASADGRMEAADADAASTATGLLAICLTAGLTDGTSGLFLLQGFVRATALGTGTQGTIAYVSTTAGDVTTTAPSATADIVRVVGYWYDTNTLYFNPSGSWVEVA